MGGARVPRLSRRALLALALGPALLPLGCGLRQRSSAEPPPLEAQSAALTATAQALPADPASPSPRPTDAPPTPIPRPSAVGRVTPPATSTPVPGRPGRLSIALDGMPWCGQAGLFLARERGYYQEAGLDAYFHVTPTREAALAALAAGQDQVALAAGIDLLRARAEGTPVIALMPIVARPLVGLIGRQGALARPRDLDGRRLAVPDDRAARAVVEAMLRADGLDPTRTRAVPFPDDPLGALAGGQLDALGGYWPREGPGLEARGAPAAVLRAEQFGLPEYEEIVLASVEPVRAARSGALGPLVTATIRGYGEVARDQRAAVDTLLRANPDLDRRVVERGMAELAPGWREPPLAEPRREERWRATLQFLAGRGLARPDLDLRPFLIDDYLPRPPTPTPRPTAPPTATPAPTSRLPPAIAPPPAAPPPAAPPPAAPPGPTSPTPAPPAPPPSAPQPPPPPSAQPAPPQPAATPPAAAQPATGASAPSAPPLLAPASPRSGPSGSP
jgi:ABC-type nitrate/sulfonate/bicarbonate transport system substrate-binding protein